MVVNWAMDIKPSVKILRYFSFFYGCFCFALPIYSQSFAESFYFSVSLEPSKEGSTENRNLLSARAAHNVQTLRALLSAMEALPQAPWSEKLLGLWPILVLLTCGHMFDNFFLRQDPP